MKTIEDQGRKQVKALKVLKLEESQQYLKSIEEVFPKEMKTNENKSEIDEIKKWEENIKRKKLYYKTKTIKYKYNFQQYEMIRSFGGSICTRTINTKKDGGINLTPSSFLKIVSSRQRVKPFLCDFYFTINHIFSENFIGIPQVCQKIFSVNINYFNQFFGIF